ncbi:hypothetical protein [uncultured Halomonas sp.]|uniref:hypothetical protein n=1 Tax=uncultured Halomonas sp. TaxID=173971 RepID=UPI002598C0B5|nr:hypothetical protein [uncultured Halomonas sp.]|tara:strand:+ start:80 stop:271 length:192 start_codon:yes stop_codon:yes gene_type:complete
MDIQEAQKTIAATLKQLEIDSDVVVRGISLHTIEVTAFGDDKRRFQQSVVIETERLPGNNWET